MANSPKRSSDGSDTTDTPVGPVADVAPQRIAKPVPDRVVTVYGETVPADELLHIAPMMRVFAVRLDSLARDPRNARRHGDTDLPTLMNSLRELRQQTPIVFNPATRIIVKGNGTHEAASRLGWAWIAAVQTDLDGAKLLQYGLVDNRSAEKSEWDATNLQSVLDEIAQLADESTLDLGDIGFGPDDLAEIEAELGGGGHDDPKPQEDQESAQTAAETKRKKAAAINPTRFDVIIECRDEPHQAEVLDHCQKNDLPCRAATG